MTIVRQLALRASSALGLLLVLGGIPAGLLRFTGSPLPASTPTWDVVWSTLTQPLSDDLLIDAAAVLVWLLWFLLTVSIIVEAVAAVRGVNAPRPPLLRPTQVLAAALIAGLTTAILVPATITPLHAAVSPPVVAATTATASQADATPIRLANLAYTAPALAPDPVASAPPTSVVEYEVVHGDWAVGVADRFLGDPDRYPEIEALNPQLAAKYGGHQPAFPDHIEPGDRLTLPASAYDRGPRTHATGHLHPQPTTAPASHGEATDPPAQPTPAPQPPTPDQPDPTPVPTAAPTPPATGTATAPAAPPVTAAPSSAAATNTPTSPTPTPTGTSTPVHTAPEQTGPAPAAATSDNMIAVVGGFVSVGLAAGLLFTVARVWLRRRVRYRPTPITTPVLDDANLTPPLAGMTQLRQALRRLRPELLQPPPAGPTVREYVQAEIKPDLPPSGPTGADLGGVGTLPLSAGLGLHGPAAHDAARGLLVSCLVAGTPPDPDAQGQVVVPAATLATLFGVSAVDLPAMRRLTVTNSVVDAITVVEEEIIRRKRILADHDLPDLEALRTNDPFAEPLPQLLLISDLPAPPLWGRLATAIRLGESVDIGAVVLGEWAHGPTLTVADDGTATGADPARQLVVLDTDAAAAMLAMLAEAHDDNPGPPVQVEPPTVLNPVAVTPDPPTPQREHPGRDRAAAMAGATSPTSRATVRVLGEPAILDPDGTPTYQRRTKIFELLTYLAVNRDGKDRSVLMETFWPDAQVKAAEASLNTLVATLRTALRNARGTPDPDPAENANPRRAKWDPVPNTGSHYHLDPSGVEVDWWTVLDEYANVAYASDDDARLRHLLAAIDAAGGQLAEGQDYEWIETDREAVRCHLIKLYTHAADLLTEPEPDHTRQLLDRACDLDPLNADLAQRAMRAAARLGDADAVRHRRQVFARALADNDIEPDDETEHFAASLLRQLNSDRGKPQ
jgi:two-component SAPR family response regulator